MERERDRRGKGGREDKRKREGRGGEGRERRERGERKKRIVVNLVEISQEEDTVHFPQDGKQRWLVSWQNSTNHSQRISPGISAESAGNPPAKSPSPTECLNLGWGSWNRIQNSNNDMNNANNKNGQTNRRTKKGIKGSWKDWPKLPDSSPECCSL